MRSSQTDIEDGAREQTSREKTRAHRAQHTSATTSMPSSRLEARVLQHDAALYNTSALGNGNWMSLRACFGVLQAD